MSFFLSLNMASFPKLYILFTAKCIQLGEYFRHLNIYNNLRKLNQEFRFWFNSFYHLVEKVTTLMTALPISIIEIKFIVENNFCKVVDEKFQQTLLWFSYSLSKFNYDYQTRFFGRSKIWNFLLEAFKYL